MLHDHQENRKYLTTLERKRFIAAALRHPPSVATFCLTLVYSGGRSSEVLMLRAGNIDPAAGLIVFESLKKRRKGVFRQVPVPKQLLDRLCAVHLLDQVISDQRLWPWGRTTAWKHVKQVMREAGVLPSCTSPKGLRHAFGVMGISEAGVPLNMMQKWLGHARIETTAIYANAVGREEREIAQRMWARSKDA